MQSHSKDVRMRVLNAIHWDLAVPRHRVTVEVSDGWVTMSGSVDLPYQRSVRRSRRPRMFLASSASSTRLSSPPPKPRARPRVRRIEAIAASTALNGLQPCRRRRSRSSRPSSSRARTTGRRTYSRSPPGVCEALDWRELAGDSVEIALPVAAGLGGELLSGLDPVGGEDQSGIDAVHPDIVADEFGRQALREHHQRRFGRVVDRLVP